MHDATLITEHLGLAHELARKLARRFHPLLDPGHAEALAFIGLCAAALDHHDSHVSFAEHAEHWIRNVVGNGVGFEPDREARRRVAFEVAAVHWQLALQDSSVVSLP